MAGAHSGTVPALCWQWRTRRGGWQGEGLISLSSSTEYESREEGAGMVLKRVPSILSVINFQGQLSFELLNLKAVPTTVVDPRQERLKKYSC